MTRRIALRLALPAGLVSSVAALVIVLPATTATSAQPFGGFMVDSTRSGDNALLLSLEPAPDRAPPGRITFYVPRGVELYAGRRPGSSIGLAAIEVEDSSAEAFTSSTLDGPIVARAVPPDHGCAVGTPFAAWYLELTLLGRKRSVPVYISKTMPGDPAGAALELELCVPDLVAGEPSTGTGTFHVRSLELALVGLTGPAARGKYLWTADVTPLATDGQTLQPEAAYELRSLMPVPNRLTLRGRYDRSRRVAVLDGRLETLAPIAPRTTVYLTALVRKITDDGVQFRDRFVGEARLDKRGRFSFKTRITKTTGFTVSTDLQVRSCAASAVSPAGCLGMTIGGAESDPVTVSLPG